MNTSWLVQVDDTSWLEHVAQVRHHVSDSIRTTRANIAFRYTFNGWHFRACCSEFRETFCGWHAQVWHHASDSIRTKFTSCSVDKLISIHNISWSEYKFTHTKLSEYMLIRVQVDTKFIQVYKLISASWSEYKFINIQDDLSTSWLEYKLISMQVD